MGTDICFFFFPEEGSGSLEHRPLIDRRQIVLSSMGLWGVAIFNPRRNDASVASEFADSNLHCFFLQNFYLGVCF